MVVRIPVVFALLLFSAWPGSGRSQVVPDVRSPAPEVLVQPSVGGTRFVGENTRLPVDDLLTGRRRFGPGAHTAWHVHPGGQLIMVEEGLGFVQRSGEPLRQLRAGESDFTPPNVPHWHGAAPQTGTTMAMIHFGGIGPFLDSIPPAMYSKAWRNSRQPLYLSRSSKEWPIGSRPDSLNYIGESDSPPADGLEFARGRFEAGGHTWWHVHPAGQLILAEKGRTLVQMRGEPVRVLEPGQSLFTPAGVAHWHGATSREAAQSVVLNFGGATLWLEPVATPAPEAVASMAERLSLWRAELPQGSGPNRVVRLIEPEFAEYTIYRPADLKHSDELPIVAFANGACRNTSIEYAAFLSELASRGYLIIAVGRDDQPMGPASTGQTTSPDGRLLQVMDEKVLNQAVDWAIARSVDASSPYRGRLRTDRIAYMGHSCGGMQALTASADRRATTTVVLNSGYYRTPPAKPPGPLPVYRRWSELHAPTLILTGGPKDVAYTIAKDSYADGAAANLPIFLASLPPLAHSGAYVAPDREWSRAVVAWLDWHLKGDRKARAQFVGKDCGLCRNPAWQDVAAHGLR